MLDAMFQDESTKSFFCVLLGNTGLPSTRISALTAAVMYRDYIFRGGYYPKGGIQRLPDGLAKRFIEYGGDLLLNKDVTRFKIDQNRIQGINIGENCFIECDNVVSNCSAKQTFYDLLGKDYLPAQLMRNIETMIPSPSAFIVYFSLNADLKKKGLFSNTWHCLSHDIDGVYNDCINGIVNISDFMFISIPSLHDKSLCPSGWLRGLERRKMRTNRRWPCAGGG